MANYINNVLVVTGKDMKSIEEFRSAVDRVPDMWTQSALDLEFHGVQVPERTRLDFGGTVSFVNFKENIGRSLSPTYNDVGYRWQIEHWGTKWNALEVEVINDIEESNRMQYMFETAWSSPDEWLKTTAKMFPNCRFSLYYSCEGLEFTGITQLQGDKELHSEFIRDVKEFIEANLSTEQEKEYKNLDEDERWDFISECSYDIIHENLRSKIEDKEDWGTN